MQTWPGKQSGEPGDASPWAPLPPTPNMKASSGVPETDHRSIFSVISCLVPVRQEASDERRSLPSRKEWFYIFTLLRVSLKLKACCVPGGGGGINVYLIVHSSQGAASRKAWDLVMPPADPRLRAGSATPSPYVSPGHLCGQACGWRLTLMSSDLLSTAKALRSASP